ncbi:amino acid adenylation domain-containing protein [Roseivirga sp. BDSF3-8]|uniref:amino acid adenylation domain-containing protein n=1 Tax=Roseivirga sp. BDSF3-8 TaxID=3241598 RepID=UPI003532193C
MRNERNNREMAIIGMAGRFPDARNLDELHDNLKNSVYSLKPLSPERIRKTTLPPEGEYWQRGYMEDIDLFDPAFFDISPGEAQTMDPGQRLILEVVQETLDNAAINPATLQGSRTGVFVGDVVHDYYKHATDYDPTLLTGNTKEFLAARINRTFRLHGMVCLTDTSCSSSLVALHQACSELALGHIDYALVCGINIELMPFKGGYEFDVASPDGHSKPFSAEANGMAYGEVVTCVMLRRLQEAEENGDIIHAVIKGSAVNNNAARSASMVAPDSQAQAEAIITAWERAGIHPSRLGFIEAHGSATQLGDNIEIGGLNAAFAHYTNEPRLCPVSSIKSNIGHGRSAAGIAGLVKAVLSLSHRQLFPSLNAANLSPVIDFEKAAVYVQQKTEAWEVPQGHKRLAGVSSMGISGTNVHVVLEEAPGQAPRNESVHRLLYFPLSAASPASFKANGRVLSAWLDSHPEASLEDVAYTMSLGRGHYRYRKVLAASSISELCQALQDAEPEEVIPFREKPGPVMVFSGNSTVPAGFVRFMKELHPAFQAAYEECAAAGFAATEAKPSAFVWQYALYRTMEALGLASKKLIGIGAGRVVTEVLAGKKSLAEALRDTLSLNGYHNGVSLSDRVEALLKRESGEEPTPYIELGLNGEVAEILRQHPHSGIDFHLFELNGAGFEAFGAMLSSLYAFGYQPEWDSLFTETEARRIVLPAYCFDLRRIWIREEPLELHKALGHAPVSQKEALPLVAGEEVTATQKQVAALWKKELEADSFHPDDDFFALGGDSLAATRVINSLNDKFGIRLDFEDMFDFPTLREISDFIDENVGVAHRVIMCWKQVLKVEQIVPRDNFFELGGHSLLASKVLQLLNESFALSLNFEDFFLDPTVEGLTAVIEERLGKGAVASEVPAGVAERTSAPVQTEAQHVFSLSHAQKRMWVVSQDPEGSVAYNNAFSFELKGPLDTEALAGAFNLLIERHESLRTLFFGEGEEAMQEIKPAGEVSLSIQPHDLRGKEQAEGLAIEIARQEIARPFSLDQAPLMRVVLIRMEENRYYLSLIIHHIISDEWSVQVLMGEVAALYNAARSGQQPALAPVLRQYQDFIRWQDHLLTHSNDMEAYWGQKLSGELPVLDFPTDRSRPSVQVFDGHTLWDYLPAEAVVSLRETARDKGLSLFSMVLAALSALLYRHTGQSDFIIGTTVAGREQQDFAGTVGMFMNMLPLRMQPAGDMSLTHMLEEAGKATAGMLSHQQYPFDLLAEKFGGRRDPGRSPLFDVLLDVLDTGADAREADGMQGLELVEWNNQPAISKYDFTVFVKQEADGRLRLGLEYNTCLFDEWRMHNFLQHFKSILTVAGNQPDLILDDIDILTRQEKEICRENGGDIHPAVFEGTILDRIKESVAAYPDRVALRFEGECLTYAEVDELATRIAGYLRTELGVGREELVGVLARRSQYMVPMLLGVMYAGASYQPLDPSLPAERLNYMLEDGRVRVLITEKGTGEILDAIRRPRHVVFREELATLPAQSLPQVATGQDRAYVLYTSGSTGKPKGVEVLHGAVLNLLENMARTPGATGSDRWLSVTNYAFDVSVVELFLPLMLGCENHLVSDYRIKTPEKLLELIREVDPDIMQCTPSLAQVLMDSGWQGLPHLRIWSVGEKLPQWIGMALQDKCAELWNNYGPTEATIFAMTKKVETEADVPSIGRPLDNYGVLILDHKLASVPAGVRGEIGLTGTGVARGYLNRADKTAAVFVDHPVTGQRIYRTGDIGFYRPDGEVEILGRIDDQIKFSGYRIETEEIENTMVTHPAVEQAAVVLVTNEKEAFLAGFYLGDASSESLRTHISAFLPSYMVPSLIRRLEEFPVTPNGKLNRKALKTMVAEVTLREMVLPANEKEEKLLAIFREVLDTDQIGTRHNFFDNGGQSLKGLKIVARIKKTFGDEITIRTLFENPTVAMLAGKIGDSGVKEEVVIPAAGTRDGYPLSPGQRRLWLLEKMKGGGEAYIIPFTYQVEGEINRNVFELAVADVIQRHDSLRACFTGPTEAPLMYIMPVNQSDDMVDYHQAADAATCRKEMEAYCGLPFDISQAPLFRVGLWYATTGETFVAGAMHHIISDEWSLEILQRDIFTAYKARQEGEQASVLPALALQFQDYTTWLSESQNQQTGQPGKSYWMERLQGELSVLELPLDKPRPQKRSFAGDNVRVSLPKALFAELKDTCKSAGASLFTGLLAATHTFLNRYTGQERMIIGTPVANRAYSELEDQIGFFVNSLPLLTSGTEGESFTRMITRLQPEVLQALEHHHYPFDKLVEDLQAGTDSSRNPLFDVMLVLHEGEGGQEEKMLHGTRFTPVHQPNAASKFDMTFFFGEDTEEAYLHIEYSTDLFYRKTIERLGEAFRILLTALAKGPNEPVAGISLVSPAESLMLSNWESGAAWQEETTPWLTLFEQSVSLYGDREAVTGDGIRLTYKELDTLSGRLARVLREYYGVGEGDIVALNLPRSVYVPALLLALHRIGAAYLPLDKGLPSARVQGILTDAGAALLVSDREEPADDKGRVVLNELLVRAEEVEPASSYPPDPASLAYVIYTSGSTGTPKGVCITHANLSHYVQWANATYFASGQAAPFAFCTSLGFDLTVTSLFTTLLRGDSIRVFASDDTASVLKEVFMPGSGVRAVKLTPSHIAMLRHLELTATEVAVCIAGGEPLTEGHMQTLKTLNLAMAVYNEYGPTETTVGCTYAEVTPGRITIGKPAPGVTVRIVNEKGVRQPIAATGELYVGGPGVCSGYLHQPGLTAKAIIPDPESPGQTLYKTGDLCRWLPDGQLEYLGRIDTQVKMNGYRLEISEIESAMEQHPHVRQAAASLIEDSEGNPLLAAWLVGDEQLTHDEMRQALLTTLPRYAVPGRFIRVPYIPISVNGKADREALHSLQGEVLARKVCEKPRTPEEKVLVSTLETVFSCEVSLSDYLFDMGIDSIKALRLVGLLYEAGYNLLLMEVLHMRPVAELATLLEPVNQPGHSAPEEDAGHFTYENLSEDDLDSLFD